MSISCIETKDPSGIEMLFESHKISTHFSRAEILRDFWYWRKPANGKNGSEFQRCRNAH
jgi:hypothetical protein